jgi:hypothetical protein
VSRLVYIELQLRSRIPTPRWLWSWLNVTKFMAVVWVESINLESCELSYRLSNWRVIAKWSFGQSFAVGPTSDVER